MATRTPRRPARSPRVDRRAAILEGAMQVFTQRGYADASMDEIARSASVAKPTLYNHFADKAELFHAVLAHYAAAATERSLAAVADLDLDAADLRAELERVGAALVACLRSPEGHAVLRMQLVEEARFPAMVAAVRDGSRDRTLSALAGQLARLGLAGRLRLDDPARGARQFLALVTDDLVLQSGNGVRAVGEDSVHRAVTDGVDTFLAAFTPR